MSFIHLPSSTRKRLALVSAVGALVALLPGAAVGATPGGAERVVTKIDGLDGARGVAVGPPRRVVYSQADGSISETVLRGDGAGTTVLGTVGPPGFAPAIAQWDTGSAYILTGGSPDEGAATLYQWSRATGDITTVADIAAYQATDPDPDNQEGEDTESNPFGVAALEDSALVADAAGNDLLRVWPDGTIQTVARIKPRVVLVPDELEGQEGVPPPGTPINAEGVATSVTVGADGAYYVGELRGFPATPGTSEIWRIEPDSVDAVCDPENPNAGACTRYADGFTSIVSLGSAPNGDLYVLELVKQSWLQWELEIAEPIGGLYRLPVGGEADLVSSDRLVLPGGVGVSRTGKPFVAGPVFGPGSIVRVR